MQKKVFILFGSVAFILLLVISCCNKVKEPQVKACFTTSTAYLDFADSFYNCSINAVKYHWDFGDGAIDSIDSMPVHVYTNLGNYTVKLIATGGNGQTNTAVQNVTVNIPPITAANYAGTYTCPNQTCSITGNDSSTITIAAVGYTGLSISNLYGTGKTFTASISGVNASIPPQIFKNGNSNALLQGSMILSTDTTSSNNNTIQLSLVITTVGQRNNCTGNFVKQ
jgi:PKD repeat protein